MAILRGKNVFSVKDVIKNRKFNAAFKNANLLLGQNDIKRLNRKTKNTGLSQAFAFPKGTLIFFTC
jgi:hypothetical protein